MSAPKANDGDARVSAVVVVGSLHYDIMVGAPDRPRKGETVAGTSWSPKFGGKGGNQALAAEGQGVPTAMVGAVGGDDFGAALLAGLDRGGVDRSAVATLSGVGSGMSVAIFDAEGDYGAVIVSGANLAISATQARDELLRTAKVLILQNEIPEEVNEDVARRARAFGVKTVLNAAPARAFETALPGYVDILVVNAIEAEMLGSAPVNSLADAEEAAEHLTSRFGAVVVTAGGDGVAFQDDAGAKISLPGVPITVQSTHGAGDMFVGTLGARLALGDDMRAALSIANQQAAKLVSMPESERGHERTWVPTLNQI
jgi:ribokinase